MPAGLLRFLTFYFRAEGRIGRAEYALGVGLIYALNAALLAFALGHIESDADVLGLLAVAGLPSLAALFVLVAKRGHDIGLPGSFVLLLFVPVVGAVWLIALGFVRGAPGANAYGPAPLFRPD